MPTNSVTSGGATAPIDRLTLNFDNLRAGTTSDAAPAWWPLECWSFEASDE